MRLIGTLPRKNLAQSFSDYLLVQGIENQIQVTEGGAFEVWVINDGQIPQAEELFQGFVKNPEASQYLAFHSQAKILRAEKLAKESKNRSQVIDLRTHWHRYNRQIGPFTLALIIISVAAALLTRLGSDHHVLSYLYMTDYEIAGGYMRWRDGFPEVLQGQIWRLWTPLFIHSGFLHLLFNLLWLKDLGTMIERRQGTWFLVAQVLVIGLLSNLAQYYWNGPNFGGMSGVVYGLLGYIWIREKFDPLCGLSLNPGVVTMMIVWFFLCMTGLVGNVANAAHAGGLAAGMAWGFLAAKFPRR